MNIDAGEYPQDNIVDHILVQPDLKSMSIWYINAVDSISLGLKYPSEAPIVKKLQLCKLNSSVIQSIYPVLQPEIITIKGISFHAINFISIFIEKKQYPWLHVNAAYLFKIEHNTITILG